MSRDADISHPVERYRSRHSHYFVDAEASKSFLSPLPPVMRERLVGLRHPVNIVSLLDRSAAQIRGIIQFVSQLLRHAFLRAAPRVENDPPDRQAGPPVLRHFDR